MNRIDLWQRISALQPMRYLFLFMFFSFILGANGQLVQIGYGTTLHQGLPIEPLAHYSYTQQLIHADQITVSGEITEIHFQYQIQSSVFLLYNNLWTIYMGHSELDELQSWIPVAELQLVYSGGFSPENFTAGLPGTGWLKIELQTPFPYNGTDNLLIAVDENMPGFSSSSDDFFCNPMPETRAINFQSMTINPDPENPPATMNLKSYLSNIRLRFETGSAPEAPQYLYGVYGEDGVQLFWQAPIAGVPEMYVVQRNSKTIGESAICSYTDYSVTTGNSYVYSVRARYPGSQLSPPSNSILIEIPALDPNLFLYESFEEAASFSQIVPGYINLDLDNSFTWGWEDFQFPGNTEPLAWMVFAPSQTLPPLTSISAHSGGKFLISMGAQTPPNNDWLILPNLRPGTNGKLSFWARSYTAAYGLERLKVLISTTDADPASFTTLNNGAFLEIPAEWTYYEFDLSHYAGQDLYLALNSVSVDAFALCVDAISVVGEGGQVDISEPVPPLPLPYPNPARKSFGIQSETAMDVTIYNIKGQKLGETKGIRKYSSEPLQLMPGLYLVKVSGREGSRVYRQVILP